ncbi:MAG TPA: hypothetical protein VIK01_21655 [Polyangiaceae bacterium]
MSPAVIAFGSKYGQIQPVRPDHGGRLELKLTKALDTTAHYTLGIFTPNAEVSAIVAVDCQNSTLAIGEWRGGPPPAWLETMARALLRSVLRSKGSDGEWPRRVTRWRPEPSP